MGLREFAGEICLILKSLSYSEKSMCKQNSHKSDYSMRSSQIWDIVFALISNLIVDSLDELV